MSIFPKRVTENENVIIHLKFLSDNKEVKYFQFRTSIISPSGKVIKCWENGFYMSPKNYNITAVKEFFYCVEYSLLVEAGKYFAKTDLFLDGKIVNSRTEENDFFYVDKVEIHNTKYIDNMCSFELRNMADNNVFLKLLDKSHNLLETVILKPKQVCSFRIIKACYIEYENGTIKPIKRNSIIYIKKVEYSWRINNNILEVFNDNTFEVFCLPNMLAYLWINCNGVNDMDELKKILEVDYYLLVEMINILQDMGIIEEQKKLLN